MTPNEEKQIAALVGKLKSGQQLTPTETGQLEIYRQQAASAASNQLLLRLVARTDFLLMPHRLPADRQNPFAQRLVDYHGHGLLWHVGGSAARRKAAERELAGLEMAGKVACHRQQGARVSHVRLTPSAYLETRARCGLPAITETLAALNRMERLADSGRYIPGNNDQKYIREFDLCDPPFHPPQDGELSASQWQSLYELSEVLGPAFFFGWASWAIYSETLIAYVATGAVDVSDPIFKTDWPSATLKEAVDYAAVWREEIAALKFAAPLRSSTDISLFPYLYSFQTVAERRAAEAEAKQPSPPLSPAPTPRKSENHQRRPMSARSKQQ